MNLSSLSGESLAAILPPNADYSAYSLSSAGVVVNFVGSGIFGFSSGDSTNVIRLTVDGVQFADMPYGELAAGLGIGVTGGNTRFVFKKSVKIEIITFSSGGVTATILGA